MVGVNAEQLIARFFAALSAYDADAAAAMVTDDYEGVAVDELPLRGSRGSYPGPAGIRAWISEVAGSWATFEIEIARIRRHGDVHIAIGVYSAHGQSGPFGPLDQRLPFVAVVRTRGEKICMIHAYSRYEDAVRAEDLASPSRT